MRYRREPVYKSMLVAWLLGGPLNLVVLWALFILPGSFGNSFTQTDGYEAAAILAASCSCGMAFAITRLPSDGVTSLKLFAIVFVSALATAAITTILFLSYLVVREAVQPGPYPFELKTHLEYLFTGLPLFVTLALIFATPAALYGAVVLFLIGYETKARG